MLIVNADDFGISEGVNRGIVEAHRRGILTSTTLMANMPAFGHAVHLAGENPSLGVGVHLNLTTGAPLLGPSRVPSLVGEGGRFLRLDRLLAGLSLGRLDAGQLEAELSVQVERVVAMGLRPTHLDSHHHVHTHPALHALVVRLAVRYGLRGIRCTVELSAGDMVGRAGMLAGAGSAGTSVPGREDPRQVYLKAVLLSLLGRLLRARARRAGLAATDHFRGLLVGLAFSAPDLHALLRRLPAGSTELMTHPGHPDRELRQRTSYSEGRESELQALLDPAGRSLVEQAGVRLGSFADLRPTGG